jgi:hypothetical protein
MIEVQLSKVMIRNRRGDTGIDWPKRNVESCIIEFSKEEQDLYDAINQLKADPYVPITSQFSIMTLQREACSSREAVYYTVKNMIERKQQENPHYQPSQGLLNIFEKIHCGARADSRSKLRSYGLVRVHTHGRLACWAWYSNSPIVSEARSCVCGASCGARGAG